MLSHGYWQRFGSDPSILGASVVFDGVPFSIVGVARKGFFGLELGNTPDVWIPVATLPQVAPQPPLLTMPNNGFVPPGGATDTINPGVAGGRRASTAGVRKDRDPPASRDRLRGGRAGPAWKALPTERAVSRPQQQFARPVLVVLGGARSTPTRETQCLNPCGPGGRIGTNVFVCVNCTYGKCSTSAGPSHGASGAFHVTVRMPRCRHI